MGVITMVIIVVRKIICNTKFINIGLWNNSIKNFIIRKERIFMLTLLSILCLSLTGWSVTTPNLTRNNEELIYRCSKDSEQVTASSDNSGLSPNLDLPIIPVYPPYPPINPPIIPIRPSIDVPYYSQSDFTKNFFINCEANVVENSIGNCGYTAISTLLTYYDTYWSDIFIPETYESSPTSLINNNDNARNYYSPGIKNNTVFSYSTDPKNLTKEQKSKEIHAFVDDAIDNKSTSFFGLLLNYAKIQVIFKIMKH